MNLPETTSPTRIAIIGCGYWSRFQLAGWHELKGVEIAAVCDRNTDSAKEMAKVFRVPRLYDEAAELLDAEAIDAVDIITDPGSHALLVEMAAERGTPIICQKPMAPALAEAQRMVAACRRRNVPFFVHENWRWQTPIRALKRVLDDGVIGPPFRARIDFATGFPVFENQPLLRELDQFILADLGSHVLDAARFLFGEMLSLHCHTRRVRPDIRGEDVATVMMHARSGATVICNMAYAGNPLEHDRFPETYFFVEGERGSVEVGPDYWVRTTTIAGTHAKRHPPRRYAWADPAYELVHASIVPCNASLLAALRNEAQAETTAADNLQTLRLVYGAYASAQMGRAIDPATDEWIDAPSTRVSP